MALIGITELRNLPQYVLSSPVSVDANTAIAGVQLEGLIQNSDVTVLTIQCIMSTAGKYYIKDSSGNDNYLTNPNEDYPAKLQLLSTWFLPKGDTCELYFSGTGTCQSFIVTMSGGIY